MCIPGQPCATLCWISMPYPSFLLHAGRDLYDASTDVCNLIASTDVCNLILTLVHEQNTCTT